MNPILYCRERYDIMGTSEGMVMGTTTCFPTSFKCDLNGHALQCSLLRLSGGTPTLCYRVEQLGGGANSRTWDIDVSSYRSAQEAITKILGPKLQ